MREEWTGDLIGRLHVEGVTRQELAEELGVSKAYVTMILNSARSPAGAQERLNGALDAIVKRKHERRTDDIV